MITKENGLRYAKLIHVSVDNGKTDNSNKVYIMEEESDGRIKCQYGRVGKKLVTEYKPSRKWSSVYKQKVSKTKGYTDVTELLSTVIENVSTPQDNKVEAIKDEVVKKLIDELMAFANKSIQRNYLVTQESVTEQQVTAAQEVLDTISSLIKIGVDTKHINDMLLRLYTIIPRQMKDVKAYLFNEIKDNNTLEIAQRLLENEQSTLDTMGGQVQLIKQQREAAKEILEDKAEGKKSKSITILEQMGLMVEVENDSSTLELINKLMGSNKNNLKKVYKVVNLKTQARFNKHLEKSVDKNKRLYFHGSRNENWFNILQTGLLIRPSGAIHTGSMFSDGIYFASKSSKSIGYTSLRGSRWTQGSDNKGFLALFDIHLGNQKNIYKHDSSCYNITYEGLKKEGFNSVYAHGGADLVNDEFIVYKSEQCTISHLIEIS